MGMQQALTAWSPVQAVQLPEHASTTVCLDCTLSCLDSASPCVHCGFCTSTALPKRLPTSTI